MTSAIRFAPLAAVALVCGCANPDSVVFVTNTSIGIDVGGTPPIAAIAYDRMEGYIAPRYDNGAVPPVVASLETGGTVFNPKIRQVYATGSAAKLATSANAGTIRDQPLGGGKKVMFFGTATTLGFKVGFAPTGYPDSVTFGFKRKEASIIPVGTITCAANSTDSTCPPNMQVDTYASVLASIDTASDMSAIAVTGLDSRQFFATGTAADQLAINPAIRDAFKVLAQSTAVTKASEQATALVAKVKTESDTVKAAIVAADGSLDKGKLNALTAKASAALPPQTIASLNGCNSVAEVLGLLSLSPPTAAALAAAASQ